jgi:zinc transport system permease protein
MMPQMLAQMFTYEFMVRALIVGLLISLASSLLGVTLVLRRFSMIGDGLSHVGFGSLALATVMNWAPLAVSLPVVLLAAFLLLRLSDTGRIRGDAAIALISASSLALGIFLVSVVPGVNADLDNYLFGSILALGRDDLILSILLCAAVAVLYTLFYHRIFAVTFDESYARASGLRAHSYNTVLALLTAFTIVLGMRMMGALLISSLIIFPALTSMWLCRRFLSVTLCSVVLALTCFTVGILVSYLYATPTGASVVLANLLAFVLFWLIYRLRSSIQITKKAGVLSDDSPTDTANPNSADTRSKAARSLNSVAAATTDNNTLAGGNSVGGFGDGRL